MSTYTPLDHWCTATPANPSIVPYSEPKSYDQFYIQFHVRFTYPFSDYDSDEDFCDNLEDTTLSKEFWIPCDQLICDNNNTSLSVISNMLSVLRVPLHVQPFMIQFIGRCAQSMVKDNVGRRKVLPMIVSIDVMGRLEDEDGTVVDEEARTVRAIESLVKALEKESRRFGAVYDMLGEVFDWFGCDTNALLACLPWRLHCALARSQ